MSEICPSLPPSRRGHKTFTSSPLPLQRISRIAWVMTALALVYYAFVLTDGTFNFFALESKGHVFDNMAVRLLQGDFTVDPAIIVNEAMIKDGKTYTYFGIFPALLRMPLLPLLDLENIYVSRLSVFLALAISVIFQVKTWLHVNSSIPTTPFSHQAVLIVLVSLFWSSPYVFLMSNASVYHEPILWAAAGASIFNYFLVYTLPTGARPPRSTRYIMAIVAGSCLLTRVSVGIGLYIAMGALIVGELIRDWKGQGSALSEKTKLRQLLCRNLGPLIVLGLFGLAYLAVNYGRWGDPFTSAYYDGNAQVQDSPARLQNIQEFGAFDYKRILPALHYYFIGSWSQMMGSIRSAAISYDWIEGPYASGLMMSPVFSLLSMVGLYAAVSLTLKDRQRYGQVATGMAAEAVSTLLLLSFMALTLRYRMDLWIFTSLASVFGFMMLIPIMQKLPEVARRILLGTAWSGVAIGILATHVALLEYKLTGFSPTAPKELIRVVSHFVFQTRDAVHIWVASLLF
jgi:hypothetical protein